MGTDEISTGKKTVPTLLFLLARSAFNGLLIRWNGLDTAGFAAWEFLPGMRFGERAAWWRDGSDRGSAHEGLDICWYRTVAGPRLSLGAGARVPAIYAGEVVAIVDDFLGVSVFVAHTHCDDEGRRLHTVYGHVCPLSGLAPGSSLDDGDAVGTIADTTGNKHDIPPHLHITLALIDREAGPDRLDWDALHDRSRVLLLDPKIIMK
jgi:murein DD-endopeptidase MepM/ murein hydrolase activator NlpD